MVLFHARMNKVFFSYSRHDQEMLEEFQAHLALLRKQGVIDTWNDRDILPGEEWDNEIKQRLAEAEIILLLVSSNFLATDYIWMVEITEAMKRHERKEARVIPIILRACHWETAPFGNLNALPPKGKPVSSYSNRDEAWLQVVEGIKRVIDLNPALNQKGVQEPNKAFPFEAKDDTLNYNIANIHKLLNTAFNDESLQTFCLLHFEGVFNNFTAGQSKAQRLLALIDFAKRHMEVGKLLSLMQEEHSAQYEQFKPYF